MTAVPLVAPPVRAAPRLDRAGLAALAAWLFSALTPHADLGAVGQRFNDPDDAMRLLEVRDLLRGQGWYDLVQHRLDPALPVPMHWSRLVDAPIALLIALFERMAPAETAERWAMIVWPQLVLLGALLAMAALAKRLAGPVAGVVAPLLLALGLSMVWQFTPGRIDHHNVQAALMLGMLATLLDPRPRAAALTGAFSGLMLAVGVETLPALALGAVAFAWRFVACPADAPAVRAYGVAFASSTAALALATLPPSAWTHGACDALSLSYLALAGCGGLGLAAAASTQRERSGRVGALAAVALVALAAFVAADPACWRGPLASLDPRLRPVWLNFNQEMQPWTRLLAAEPVAAVVMIAGPAMAVFAGLHLAMKPETRHRPAVIAILLGFVVFLAVGLAQVRSLFYANLLAAPLLAAAIADLADLVRKRGGSVFVAAAGGLALVNNATWALAAASLLPETAMAQQTGADACFDTASYAALAETPPGLVLSTIDTGPFILLATPHSVLSAPYHRQVAGILDASRIFSAPPPVALAALRDRKVDQIALCSSSREAKRYVRLAPDGLLARIDRGEAIPGLQPVSTDGAVRVYRVAP